MFIHSNVLGLLYLYVWKCLLLFCAFEHESADTVIIGCSNLPHHKQVYKVEGAAVCIYFPEINNNVIDNMEYVNICMVHYYWLYCVMLLCGLWHCCKFTCVAMLSRNILYRYLDSHYGNHLRDIMVGMSHDIAQI